MEVMGADMTVAEVREGGREAERKGREEQVHGVRGLHNIWRRTEPGRSEVES